MMTSRSILLGFALLLSTGCVSLQPSVLKTAAPKETTGYVAVIGERDATWGYGLGIIDKTTGRDRVLSIGELSGRSPNRKQEVMLIELPAGEYRVGYWVTFGWLLHQQSAKKDFPAAEPLARPFKLSPGQVVVLGHVAGLTEQGSRTVKWTIVPQRASEAAVLAAFRAAYPAFAQAPVECLTCGRDAPRKPAAGGRAPAK